MNLPQTLDIASQKAGISKAEYIRQAIIDRLRKDGFEVIRNKDNNADEG